MELYYSGEIMNIDLQLGILEDQLSQILVWCEGIKVISDTWRKNETLRDDSFIFRSVYDSMWDAVIVKIICIWDDGKDRISLSSLKDPSLNGLKRKISTRLRDQNSDLAEIKSWRNQIVAHRAKVIRDKANGEIITAADFDKRYSLRITTIEKELKYIEDLLIEARILLKQPPIYLRFLKEEAADDAKQFLALWRLGKETLKSKDELKAVVQKFNSEDE
jgi:hypothetical protein